MEYKHSWRKIEFENGPPTLIMVLPDEVSAVSTFFGSEISHGDIEFYYNHFMKILSGELTNAGQPGNAFVADIYPEKSKIYCIYIENCQAEIETDELLRLMKIWGEAHRMFYKEKVPMEQLP